MTLTTLKQECQLDVKYDFGSLRYFDTYVIGMLNDNVEVNTAVAKEILSDIDTFYQDRSVVYISNRQFHRSVDPSVYKLVDPKMIKGIAIVGYSDSDKLQAMEEQSLYAGRFTYFLKLDDAISWAESLF